MFFLAVDSHNRTSLFDRILSITSNRPTHADCEYVRSILGTLSWKWRCKRRVPPCARRPGTVTVRLSRGSDNRLFILDDAATTR
jgi:hypothetical protein